MCHFFLSLIISHSHLSISLPKSNHLASPRSLSLLAGLHAPATDDSAAPIPRRSAVLFLAGARQLLLSSRSPLVTPPHTRRMQTEADHGAKPEPADVTSDAKPRVEDLVREVVAWEDLTARYLLRRSSKAELILGQWNSTMSRVRIRWWAPLSNTVKKPSFNARGAQSLFLWLIILVLILLMMYLFKLLKIHLYSNDLRLIIFYLKCIYKYKI